MCIQASISVANVAQANVLKARHESFVLDLWLQGHNDEENPMFYSTHHRQPLCQIWTLVKKWKRSSGYKPCYRFWVHLTLTFDFKVISVIRNITCHQQTIGNRCAKYEQPWSKMKEEFALYAIKHIQSIFDLDLWLQGHIGNLKPSL